MFPPLLTSRLPRHAWGHNLLILPRFSPYNNQISLFTREGRAGHSRGNRTLWLTRVPGSQLLHDVFRIARGLGENTNFSRLDDKAQAATQTCFAQRACGTTRSPWTFTITSFHAFLPLLVRYAISNSLSLLRFLDIIPPAPTRSPPAGARTSSPWRDTSRWPWRAQRGPAAAGRP